MEQQAPSQSLRMSGKWVSPGAYSTHNATYPLSDIYGGNFSDYIQIQIDSQKKSLHIIFFHLCRGTPRARAMFVVLSGEWTR